MRTLKLVSFLSVVLAWGCSYVSPPIRLSGRPGDLEALAGKWTGSYQGEGLQGRSGTITFTLMAGEGHAHGDVLMTPSGYRQAYQRYERHELTPSGREMPLPSESLTIQFVQIDDGRIMGRLEAYWDPDRDSQAYTTFVGSMHGDTIDGTFYSTYSRPSADSSGRWKVKRNR